VLIGILVLVGFVFALPAITSATPPPGKGGPTHGGGNQGGGKGEGKGKGKGPVKDKTPPETTISGGPRGKIHSRTAKFRFVSSEAGSTFQCKLDRKPFKTCRSPKKYTRLKPGRHVFKVRAIDAAGNVDPTAAKRAFTVLR
jgi:hypothetical protein